MSVFLQLDFIFCKINALLASKLLSSIPFLPSNSWEYPSLKSQETIIWARLKRLNKGLFVSEPYQLKGAAEMFYLIRSNSVSSLGSNTRRGQPDNGCNRNCQPHKHRSPRLMELQLQQLVQIVKIIDWPIVWFMVAREISEHSLFREVPTIKRFRLLVFCHGTSRLMGY